MTSITVQHVTKRFTQASKSGARTVYALQDVSVSVRSGDTLAILGPSGCGKSTLLRVIAGLTKPDAGEVFYDRVNLNDIPLQERGIGMVFQDGALVPHWEAERTIGFHLWLRHRQQEVPERIARISQITGFGMDALLERRPRELSGGEKQRVAVARALARDPRVFLFDEPFSNLDAKLRTQARFELHRLLDEFPVTSIYVTHDQIEASALADCVAVMREGRIEQLDAFAKLYDDPHNLFVATFIGTPTINLLEGTVRDHCWHGMTFGGFPVREGLAEGTRLLAGVRAEGISFAPEGELGQIALATLHLEQRRVELEVRANGEHWTMFTAMEEGFRAGDPIPCAIDPAAVLYFDPETGRRVS
ncbi:MAG: ABC transporter ATP-binding protein [Anaerolineae bacterium]|nr:ABC transporter ATP-binding protein [Anaerolineae bacterium]